MSMRNITFRRTKPILKNVKRKEIQLAYRLFRLRVPLCAIKLQWTERISAHGYPIRITRAAEKETRKSGFRSN